MPIVHDPPLPRIASGKINLLDYDYILARSDDECCFSLSDREVQILLALLEPVQWVRRWMSPTGGAIDEMTITHWEAELARKLMSGCCPDDLVLHRVTDDGILQQSTDGGVTWTDSPEDDPRVTATASPNPYTGEPTDIKCQAANSAVTALKEAEARQAHNLEIGAGLAAMIDDVYAIMLLFGVFTGVGAVLATIALAVATIVFLHDHDTFVAAFTDDVWNDLLCCIFCNMGDDASISTAQWQSIKSCISAADPGIAGDFLSKTINTLGAVGLQNAARSGLGGDLDCSSCCPSACEDKYDVRPPFNTTNHGHVVSRSPGHLVAELGDLGYLILMSDDVNDCCFVNSWTTVSGSPSMCCFIPCGTPYSEPAWVFATAVGQCVHMMQWQGAAGSQVDIVLSDCP